MSKTEHFWIRIEPWLRGRAKAMATADGISEAEFVRRLIEKENKRRSAAMRRLQRLGQEIEAKD